MERKMFRRAWASVTIMPARHCSLAPRVFAVVLGTVVAAALSAEGLAVEGLASDQTSHVGFYARLSND